MALSRTTLTTAISASQLTFPVASTATGFPPVGTVAANQPIVIEDETMFLTGVPVAGTIVVRGRGSDGTPAIAHDIGSPVVTSATPGDFPALPIGFSTLRPVEFPDNVTYGQDGAVAVPVQPTNAFFAKTSAAAMTLAAPSLALNGITLTITSQTAFAHVLTATALINNGATGSPFTTVTFPAFPGASLTLEAQNGLWNVQASQGTFTYA